MNKMDLRDIQDVELEILKFVSEKCDKNNLRYGLTSGTVLGAIRHGGFIPWDDDIDIVMPRKDYMELLQLSRKENWGDFIVKTPYTDKNFVYDYMKVMDVNTELIEDPNRDKIHTHIYIDIFPVDGVSGCKLLRRLHFKFVKLAQLLFIATRRARYNKNRTSGMKKILWEFIDIVSKNNNCAIKLLDKISKVKDYDNASYAAVVTGQGEKEVLTREQYTLDGIVEFEGCKFKTYRYPQIYLEKFFGDYMKLPPEDQRRGHDCVAWKN